MEMDWRSAMIIPLYKNKRNRTECRNYTGISLLIVVGKIFASILVDRIRRVTGGLIDDEQWSFRAGRGYVNQIFTLQQIECMLILWIWRRHMIGLIGENYGKC